MTTNKQSYWFEIHAYFRDVSHTHEVRATSLKAAKELIKDRYLGQSVRIKHISETEAQGRDT
jgi:hypothetical protein